MDVNPYQSPQASVPAETEPSVARRKVIGPAVGMIVCSIVGLFYCFGWGAWAFVFTSVDVRAELAAHGVYYALVAAIGLSAIVYAAMLFGSVQMLLRRRYGWAMAASILALVPCNSFTVLSIGFGVWGILVLRRTHVKAVFR